MNKIIEWLKRLFGIKKTKEELRQEIEESNEQHYIYLKLKVEKETEIFKLQHKEIIEYNLNKPISEITIKELLLMGFHSNNITQKHINLIMEPIKQEANLRDL